MKQLANGTLIVEVSYAQQALPVNGIQIRITSSQGYDGTFITNDEGKTPEIVLQAPSASLSLNEATNTMPYATYTIEISKDNEIMRTIEGVQIFSDVTSLQKVELNPIRSFSVYGEEVFIPEHTLYSGEGGSGSPEPIEENLQFVLAYPIIPSQVRVHLGRPGTNARIVTVSFQDYVKNVASSEIYPTWPEEALRANIYCIMSLALNRIYTEWYPSKGYNFDITNSTTVDQAFVFGRDIFSNISKIVDELFTEYVRKIGTINPYYTEYCDGKKAQCPGLKQWGTVDYANQGLNALEILKKYYTNIEIVSTARIEQNIGSFPGYSLRVGVRDNGVAIIQNQLNRISVNYPNIKPVIPVDGVFSPQLEESVKTFQRQFNLAADGVIGKATWYKVSAIYSAVKKLAELKSEGITEGISGQYPGIVLREGSNGVYVQELQFYLNAIADYTPLVSPIRMDGNFGRLTTGAVINFQNMANLTPDGLVGPQTWDTIVKAYKDTQEVDTPIVPPVVPFPGTILELGSTGEAVKSVQFYLNRIYLGSSAIQQLLVDGVYGEQTQDVVRTFQQEQNLTPDGIVGQETWDSIIKVYNTTVTYALTTESNYQVYDYTTGNNINLMYNV